MLEPKVTIVTPVFNLIKSGRKDFFRQCVESVHNQTYKNIEHLIIDGASTDGTLDLIKEYADKGWVRYISEPDKGHVDAMNKGLKMASGEYVAILNSDDYYILDAIEVSMNKILAEKADYSSSLTDKITNDNEGRFLFTRGGCFELFFIFTPHNHETMLCKKSVFEKVGYLSEKKYDSFADHDLYAKLIMEDYKPVFINRPLMKNRIMGYTNDFESKQFKKHIKYVFKWYSDFWGQFLSKLDISYYQKRWEKLERFLDASELKYVFCDKFNSSVWKFLYNKKLKNYNYNQLFLLLLQQMKNYKSGLHLRLVSYGKLPILTAAFSKKKGYIKFMGIFPIIKIKMKKDNSMKYKWFGIIKVGKKWTDKFNELFNFNKRVREDIK